MLTAAITAAITFIASLFGIQPGTWVVGVAIGVKVVIVGVTLIFGARLVKKRADAAAAAQPPEPPDAGSPPRG